MGDLREWIETMDAQGELRTARGVDWDVELGVIVDQYQRRMNLPALLFDEIWVLFKCGGHLDGLTTRQLP